MLVSAYNARRERTRPAALRRIARPADPENGPMRGLRPAQIVRALSLNRQVHAPEIARRNAPQPAVLPDNTCRAAYANPVRPEPGLTAEVRRLARNAKLIATFVRQRPLARPAVPDIITIAAVARHWGQGKTHVYRQPVLQIVAHVPEVSVRPARADIMLRAPAKV